jgi:SAM-dependent methyltransferase
MSFDATQFRTLQRNLWSSGDWPSVAETIQPVADQLVERVDVKPGQAVLDVGTGSGNAAIAAAERGARVVGGDITPELFDAARARAAAAGVEVEWVEADAADLPMADDSFDVVLSTFGVIFAPHPARAAAELVRVTRPGGVIGICAWTPDGLTGRMLAMMRQALPPPPPEVQPPVLWGSEDFVRVLFEGSGVELEFERVLAEQDAASVEEWVSELEMKLGPLVMAKAMLEPTGLWAGLRGRLVELFSECEADDGTFRGRSEYLRTVGRLSEGA